ncbi:MAG: hypothetical protein IH820_13190, partial [Bacteroidetes bacterium]|nr:hypothetical protein [Bacteroidota bacterium]
MIRIDILYDIEKGRRQRIVDRMSLEHLEQEINIGDQDVGGGNSEIGPPLGNLQTLFLDFDQNRSGGGDIDFLEDLREYGLSSDATAQSQALEPLMRFWVVTEILARIHPYYGRAPNGDPGPDAANIVFVGTEPQSGTYSVLCVGGESVQGGSFLGAASLDENNLE